MMEEPETTTAEYWKKRWEVNSIGWHRDEVNKMLQKYLDELTGGRSSVRVFVPLCGKSLDMLWLAEQGHNVVGVELSKLAIECFFKENNLKFSAEQVKLVAAVDPVDVYKCTEKPVTIFSCDLFALSEEDVGGRFDAIWDRGSLSAMQPAVGDRGKRYTKKMRSLLADDGNYLLESHYYELDRGNSPPASISIELRNEIFGEDFVLRELEVEKFRRDEARPLSFPLDYHYHLIVPKAA
ncbi:probable thiopurine S-methyltransferase [Montipora capricornis]|uniref:probable thiopurine S-methyltransferase n=1 Tax=Montipora foliosa TaxID=591990 RepID=UPI0035F1035D